MSTPVPAPCPNCGREVETYEMPASLDRPGGRTVRWMNWSYWCRGDGGCGWVWANELQRAHNNDEMHKACKRATTGLWGG